MVNQKQDDDIRSTQNQKIQINKQFKQKLFLVLLLPLVFVGLALFLLVKFIINPFIFFNRQSRIEYKAPEIPDCLQEEYIEVNGIKLHTVQGGDKNDAPLMIFLHGFPEFWYSWRHQLKEFSKRYFVVAIDMRGYNLSDKPQSMHEYSVEIIASDVAQVVEKLGYKNCILVGHDWGAFIAQFAAQIYPQIVSKLIVMASVNMKLIILNKTLETIKKMGHTTYFLLPWLPEILMSCRNFEAVRNVMSPGTSRGPIYPHANSVEEVEWYVCAAAIPGAITATLNYYRMYGLWRGKKFKNSEKLRQKIQQPSLIILGQEDGFIPRSLWNQPESGFQDFDVKIIEHCSHWVPFDRPDEVNKHIKEFLQHK